MKHIDRKSQPLCGDSVEDFIGLDKYENNRMNN